MSTVSHLTAAMPAACAVCGSQDRTTFKHAPPYQIVRCYGCGVRYLFPQPPEEGLKELYDEGYFHSGNSVERGYSSYTEETANIRAMFRDRMRLLPADTDGRKLLDVGAATGIFVEQARNAGWAAEGIEPSEWAAKHFREVLGQPVATGTLAQANYPASTFDVVTMWEVIEHIPQPDELLSQVARVLKGRGYLLLSTPDAGSLVARALGRRWLGWSKIPEHLWYFDLATLSRLLENAGFDVVRHKYVSLTVSCGYALNRLASILRLPALANIRWLGGERPMRVNPFYDLFVVARKRR